MLRRLLLLLVLVACTLAGAWAGLRIAGPASVATDVGDVRVAYAPALPGERGVGVYVPLADWGLRARVTAAPVQARLEPRRIDRAGVVRVASEPSAASVRTLRRQLSDGLGAAAIRSGVAILLGALGGGIVAALLMHLAGSRGRRLLLVPVGGVVLAVVLGGGTAAWAAATWDPERLERPAYYASGTELERILDSADQLRSVGKQYGDRVDTAVRSIAGLIDDRTPLDVGARRLMLASDIHLNALVIPTLRRYGEGIPAVLAGDFSVNGSRIEGRLLDGLEDVGTPVLAVSGNHDAPGVMRQLARRGVDVLTHTGRLGSDGSVTGPAVQTVAGLRVAGFEDPLEYAGGQFPTGIRTALSFGDLPDGKERFAAAVEQQWGWWQALPERPQVLVVHQEAIGRALAARIRDADPDGAPVAILVGHTHRQRLDRVGPVTVVNSGSAGAGGIFGAGSDRFGLALLDLDAGGALEATDLVQLDPLSGAAQARRVITARPDCDEELVFCAADGQG